jgi:hypothetical protein
VRTLPGAIFVATLGLVIATAMLGRRTTLREMALLVPVAFIALMAERQMPYLAIAAAPFFASQWPDPLARWRTIAERPGPARTASESGSASRSRSTERLARAVALVAAAAVLAVAIGVADAKLDESTYPRAALSALPSGPGLFNQYDWGGYLIFAAPGTPVFIDGRLIPFIPAVVDDYRVILNAHPGWEDVAARRRVTTMLLRPSDPIAIRAPDRGWRVIYRDALAVVLAR